MVSVHTLLKSGPRRGPTDGFRWPAVTSGPLHPQGGVDSRVDLPPHRTGPGEDTTTELPGPSGIGRGWGPTLHGRGLPGSDGTGRRTCPVFICFSCSRGETSSRPPLEGSGKTLYSDGRTRLGSESVTKDDR